MSLRHRHPHRLLPIARHQRRRTSLNPSSFFTFFLLGLNACLSAIVEKAKSCFVDLVPVAAHGPLEFHETAVGLAVQVD